MTRKRFIKLLMGHGYSKRSALDYADKCLVNGIISYREAYEVAKFNFPHEIAFRAISSGQAIRRMTTLIGNMNKMGESAKRVSEAFSDFATAFERFSLTTI